MSRDWIAYAPSAELLAESVRITRRMQRLSLPTTSKTPVQKMASPGRLITRNAVRAAGLRAAGNPMAAMKVPQFRGQHVARTVQPPGVVGIMADVSASMRWSTTAVGEAAWLLARGAAHSGARVASVAFGTGVDPIVFPGEVPQTVLIRSANEYGHNPDRALAALDGALGLSNSTTAGMPTSRIVVILSDLMWSEERKPFIARARALMARGVRFIVIGLPLTGLSSGALKFAHTEPDFLRQLGIHVPIDPLMLQAGNPQHDMLTGTIRQALLAKGAAAFPHHQPEPLTGAEVHAARAAGVARLEPMLVIPRVLLGDYLDDEGYYRRSPMSPDVVRRQIVDHTLRMLERME